MYKNRTNNEQVKQRILHGALGGARLGCGAGTALPWGSPLGSEPAQGGKRSKQECGWRRGGVAKAVQDPLDTPSSGESELQRDTTLRGDQGSWKRRK